MGIPLEFFWVIAILLLAAAVFYFGTCQRPLTPSERERSEKAARENWGKEKVE